MKVSCPKCFKEMSLNPAYYEDIDAFVECSCCKHEFLVSCNMED